MKTIFCIISFALCFLRTSAQEVDIADTTKSSIIFSFDSQPAHVNTVETRKVPDSVVSKLREDGAYWYANVLPSRKKEEADKQSTEHEQTGSSGAATFIWLLMIAIFIAALVWYLSSSNIRLFRKPSTTVYSAEEEAINEDIFGIDYDHQTKNAIASGNYRLATRLLYLRTLRELADVKLIDYKHEKTNSEYLLQLSGTSYYKEFFRLTRDFEYTWYGKFQLSPEAFDIVQSDFASFKQKLS
ncbi:MAG: DUF4129 domain-containing protein [Flavisolibacter sp.]